MIHGKEHGCQWPEPVFRYNPRTCLEEPRKIIKTTVRQSVFQPKLKSRAVTA
jgi:hypothetical protein